MVEQNIRAGARLATKDMQIGTDFCLLVSFNQNANIDAVDI